MATYNEYKSIENDLLHNSQTRIGRCGTAMMAFQHCIQDMPFTASKHHEVCMFYQEFMRRHCNTEQYTKNNMSKFCKE